MKHRTPPIQRSIENPPKSVLQNLIHSGVVLGGERELRPYLAKLIDAISLDKPVCTLYKQHYYYSYNYLCIVTVYVRK